MKEISFPGVVRLTVAVVTLLALASCTTNSFVLGFFYGRMDNRMSERILEVATFTTAQEAEINAGVDQFFDWHRREELPRYAELLLEVQRELAAGASSQASVLDHMDSIRDFSRAAFRRSPFANSADFLQHLSDRQVTQIADHFEESDRKFLERLKQREKEGGEDRRFRAIVKNVGRFGISLNDDQQQILKKGLASIDNDPMDRHQLWNRWEEQLVTLLKNRNAPGFAGAVTAHLLVYQEQMQIHRARQSAGNRAIVAAMIDKLINSLDQRQRETLLVKLGETRSSLLKLAQR